MRLRNSTGRTITIQTSVGPIPLAAGKAFKVVGIVETLAVGGAAVDSGAEPEAAGPELRLPPQAMIGGTDNDTPTDPLDGGTGNDTPTDPLDGGAGNDTPTDPLDGGTGNDTPTDPLDGGAGDLVGGSGARAGGRSRAMLLDNQTGQAMKVLVERSIPVNKAFRILGRLGTLEIIDDDGGIAVILKSPRKPSVAREPVP